uniref:Gustatory receptor n=1 Tax=Anopheles funestus TaxID=62324 RepID=A0A182RQ52_ANOFN
MNSFYQNEMELLIVTSKATNYRPVVLLSGATVWKGLLMHLFFQVYYISEFYNYKDPFPPLYITCCVFMYADLALEYVLGFCDCLLLIALLQLDRLVKITKHVSDSVEHGLLYIAVYNRIVSAVGESMGPYFGPILLSFCSYVSLEVALCILDLCGYLSFRSNNFMHVLANSTWLLTDLMKLMILFLLSEGVNAKTFRHRIKLAGAMNALYHSELKLIEATGNPTSYRIVRLLATLIIWKALMVHIFFQTLYITQYYDPDKPFLPTYVNNCLFMYVDLAVELVLGLCDCLLLIARLQLERLLCIAKDLGAGIQAERLLQLYVTTYYQIVVVLRNHLSPYFGLTIVLHCSYVCFEVAICILDLYSKFESEQSFDILVLGYIIWPLSDVTKLTALFLLSEGVDGMHTDDVTGHCFKGVHKATAKLAIFFTVSVLGSGYLMVHSIIDYYVFSGVDGNIWSFVYIVNNATFGAVLCALPWQTFRQRNRLAAAMNVLYENELSLIKHTGVLTNYCLVKMLAIVIVCNGVILHLFFHSYYVNQHYSANKPFLPAYVTSCLFLYLDLAMEFVLGLCDCLLLIIRLQLERLVWLAKNLDTATQTEHLFRFYVTMYNKIIEVLRHNLGPYFGRLILLHCAFACLEVAICILDVINLVTNNGRPIMRVLANILWPLSDVKKLSALFLLSEGVNMMCRTMNVCDNLRVLVRCLRFLGLFSVQPKNSNYAYESIRYAALKFIIFFSITVFGSAFSLYRNVMDYPAMVAIDKRTILPFFYIAHTITFCAVFCILPWQTVLKRRELATLMNILNRNEADLIALTGNGINNRIVTMLAFVCCLNGIVFHLFFHFYYVDEFCGFGSLFLPLYIVSCFFLYIDLAMEYVLGLCDCLLLIAQLQLERLMWFAKDLGPGADIERTFRHYAALYNRTVYGLRYSLSRYFGPMLTVFCTYVSLEVAICVLAIVGDTNSYLGQSYVFILANVLWPVSDIKKLVAVFLLSERTNRVWLQTSLNNMSAIGIALVSYDRQQQSYGRLTTFRFTIQFLYAVFCVCLTLVGVWQDFDITVLKDYVFNEALFILTTASFCVVWLAVPVYVYWRCARLVCALNSLLANDAELRHATATMSLDDSLSYQQAKRFACVIQCDGMFCCLLLTCSYMIFFLFQSESWHYYLPIVVYIYEDLCLSILFGFYSTVMFLCLAQLSCVADLLQIHLKQHSGTVEECVRFYCAMYDRICLLIVKPFYEYSGPIIVTFCPLIILEGSLKLFHLYDLYKTSEYGTVWTELLVNIIECLWLCFDCKKLLLVVYVSEILKQKYMQKIGIVMVKYDHKKQIFNKVQYGHLRYAFFFTIALLSTSYLLWRSSMDYIVYKLESNIFDTTIFIINSTLTCTICLVIPLQCYRKHIELTTTLNALLKNECILRRVVGLMGLKPYRYKRATIFSRLLRCDGIACASFFYFCYVAIWWRKDEFFHIHLSTCIYLVIDLSLEWTFGLYCLVMLVGIEQLSYISDLMWKGSNERIISFDQIFPHFFDLYDRMSNDVRKGLSVYYGPLVLCFTAFFVLECAISIVDLWRAISDGGGELTVLTLGGLWQLFDIKKFVILILVSEHFNQKWLQTLLNNMSAIGLALVRYDGQLLSYSKLSVYRLTLQYLNAFFWICLVVFFTWKQFDISGWKNYILDEVLIFVSSGSYCVTWCAMHFCVYKRCTELICALNSLLANDAELRQATATMSLGDSLSYQHAKRFACVIQCDGMCCFLFLACGYMTLLWVRSEPWYIYLSFAFFLYEDLCLSALFGFYSTVMFLCLAQLSCAAKLLKSQHIGVVQERVSCFCTIYDRTCTLIAKPFYEYCGPIIAIVCPMIIFEGSPKLFQAYDIYTTSAYQKDWTVILLHGMEWIWLLFDCKKLFVVLYLSELFKQKVSKLNILLLCTKHRIRGV